MIQEEIRIKGKELQRRLRRLRREMRKVDLELGPLQRLCNHGGHQGYLYYTNCPYCGVIATEDGEIIYNDTEHLERLAQFKCFRQRKSKRKIRLLQETKGHPLDSALL